MKDEARSAAAAPHPHPHHEPKHQFEHDPTVIHHPEEDMTILGRWVKRGMDQGARFWFLLFGLVAVVIVLGMAGSMVMSPSAVTEEAWGELAIASTPGQKIEVAEDHPTTKAALAARLQAATEFLYDATRDLPGNREAVLPQLRKALDNFQLVAKEAPADSPEALTASLGVARTLETRNELPEAIQQYKVVAQKWPGTPEAKEADRLAKALQDPQVIAFYKDLYAYKAPSALLPPGGTSGFNLPAGHPDPSGPAIPAPGLPNIPGLPALPDLPAPMPTPGGVTPGATAPAPGPAIPGPGTGPGPLDIAPPPTSEPAKPAAEPKPAPEPAKGALPSDPFAKPAAPK